MFIKKYIVLKFDINYEKDIPNFVIFISQNIYIYFELVSDFAIKIKIIGICDADSVERNLNYFFILEVCLTA